MGRKLISISAGIAFAIAYSAAMPAQPNAVDMKKTEKPTPKAESAKAERKAQAQIPNKKARSKRKDDIEKGDCCEK